LYVYQLLSGMRIVEGSAFVAAPLGGMTLAQLGADVIRFDDVRGGIDYGRWPLAEGGRSIYWASMNKGKRSIAINLREAEGRELIAALITADGADSGMFLTNLPMRRELAFDALKARRADVIALQISGHSDGATAVDYTVNAGVGFPHVTGNATQDSPVNAALPAWDLATGLTAATGLLAAERYRRSAGEGQHINLALSDVAYAAAGNLGYIGEWQLNGTQRSAIDNDIYGAFGRDFPTKDGRRVMVAAISLRQWHCLVKATETGEQMTKLAQLLDVDLDDEGARYEAREMMAPLIKRWTERHTLAQVAEAFDTNGVCWGTYRTFGQMVDEDPRCSEANPLFQTTQHPQVGQFLTPGSPLFMGALARQDVAPAPVLGQHTDAILADIVGLDSHQIGDLHDRGVVKGPASS
jgi:2-methylfumaryl-CoA isomerase